MKEILIAVEINNKEADIFRKMRESGAFDVIDGSVTLHFSHTGRLLKIERKLSTSYPQIDS